MLRSGSESAPICLSRSSIQEVGGYSYNGKNVDWKIVDFLVWFSMLAFNLLLIGFVYSEHR